MSFQTDWRTTGKQKRLYGVSLEQEQPQVEVKKLSEQQVKTAVKEVIVDSIRRQNKKFEQQETLDKFKENINKSFGG